MKEYRIQYHANVHNDHLDVVFYRLYRDVTDIMSDALNRDWQPEDDFHIHMTEKRTTYSEEVRDDDVLGRVVIRGQETQVLETVELRTKDKKVANAIWYLAATGASYQELKSMYSRLVVRCQHG